ncbi:MAG: hypothetical protein QM537_05890, partial [Candidatus Symbiobacter sp.]|nr:hypothetical protein [Candidatus Symbiobacter sp.]
LLRSPFYAPPFTLPLLRSPFYAPAFDAPAFDAPAFDAPAFDAPFFDTLRLCGGLFRSCNKVMLQCSERKTVNSQENFLTIEKLMTDSLGSTRAKIKKSIYPKNEYCNLFLYASLLQQWAVRVVLWRTHPPKNGQTTRKKPKNRDRGQYGQF